MKIFNFNKKGFTLMELIVTVILVAVLASYAVYHYTNVMREGEVKAARGKLSALGGAVERFKIEHGVPEITGPILIQDASVTGTCNFGSTNPTKKMMSIFTCGYVERSLGFDQNFNFYFGSPSSGICGGNINTITAFMIPKSSGIEGYPKCAFFNPTTDSTVEVQ